MTKGAKEQVAIYLKMVNQMGPTVRQAEAQLGGFRKRVHRDFQRWGAALALVIAGALSASASVGADFEQSLANVGAVARATGEEMAALEAKARSLGESTAFSAGQAAEAMYSLSSGGLDVQQTIAASEPVLKLAGATMTSMGEAAELTMGSMKMFGLQATDSERIVNVFAAGIQNSMLNMQRLSDSMTYAGQMASTMGMSIEETTSALALLHNAGIKGSMAGTGLRMMLMALNNPSKEVKDAMGGLTVQVDGLGAVLDRLKNSDLDLANAFDARAFSAVNALVQEGSAGFEDMTAKLTGTNAAVEMYDRQMATTQSKFKMFKSALQENMIAVFLEIKPALDIAIEAVTEFVKASKDDLMTMAQRLVEVLTSLWGVLKSVFGFIRDHIDLIKNIAIGVGTVVTAFYALSVAIGAVNAVMAISPLGWIGVILSGIAVGIGVVVTKLGGWRKAWIHTKAVFAAGLEGLKALFKLQVSQLIMVKDAFVAFKNTVGAVFGAIWESIKDFVGKAGKALMGLGEIMVKPWKAKEIWNEMKSDLQGGLLNAFDGLDSEVADYWSGVKAAQDERVAVITQDAVAAVQKVKAERDAALAAVDIESEESSSSASSGTPGRAIEPGQGFWSKKLQAGQAFYQKAQAQYQAYAAQIRQVASTIPFIGSSGTRDVGRESDRAMDLIKSNAADAMSGVADSIADAVTRGKDLLQSLGNVGKSVFGSLVSGFLKFGISSGLSAIPGLGAIAPFIRASGGPVAAGMLYRVNEYGKEFFQPSVPGQIVPAGAAAGGGGNTTINVSLNVDKGSLLMANDDMAINQLADKVGRRIDGFINRGFRR